MEPLAGAHGVETKVAAAARARRAEGQPATFVRVLRAIVGAS
jgi:hypothetical protein